MNKKYFLILTIFFFIFLFLPLSTASGDSYLTSESPFTSPTDTGWKSPTNTGYIYNNWDNPGNAYSQDDVYATEVEADPNTKQDYEVFDFDVPSNAIIDGIEVKTDTHGGDGSKILEAALSWDGGNSWTSIQSTGEFPESDRDNTYVSVGSSSDTWGRDWSPGEFDNSNFFVWLRPSGGGGYTMYCDHIQVQVYYHQDTTAPSIDLIHAGSKAQEKFNPDTITTNYYYRNGTRQDLDYMYVEANVTDNVGVDSVTLEWSGSGGKTNYSMTHGSGATWYKNMTGLSQYDSYTFDIIATDTSGNSNRSIWKYVDYESSWGTEEDWRKYVGLNCGGNDFSYEQFYLHNASYTSDMISDRALSHEGPTDGTVRDTGKMLYSQITEPTERWCQAFTAFGIDETIALDTDTTIEDMYVHVFWNHGDDEMNFGIGDEDSYSVSSNLVDPYTKYSTDARETVTPDPSFKYSEYYLESAYHDIASESEFTFSDNNINLFYFKTKEVDVGSSPVPSVIGTHHYQSFVILNVPSNSTLQGMDSDNDGLNDYQELYTYYTDPRDSDTDDGGESDKSEVDAGRNPLVPGDDISDLTPPTYSNTGDNSTDIVSSEATVKTYVYWEDNVQLDTAEFYENSSGSFSVVDTCSYTSSSGWCNKTIDTSGDGGKTICWKQYANDTADNLNDTMSNTDHCFDVNNAPNQPDNPTPSDGATGVSTDVTLEVNVNDDDGDSMDVTFYNASDDSVIDTDYSVPDGGTAQGTWSDLSTGTTYNWYARADDGIDTNQSSTWSFTTNYKPTPDFTYSPTNPQTQENVDFTDQSSDQDGTIESWNWDFGDGGSSSQQNPTHSYSDDGTYTVNLTVTDNDGAKDWTTQDITVSNRDPTASFTEDSPKDTYQDVNFDASSSSDQDGSIDLYEWDWTNDGTYEDSGSDMVTPTHQYEDNGIYTVKLRVTDDDSATSTTTNDVQINNRPPAAFFTYSISGKTVDVDASSSDDQDGTISSYEWDWTDDGSYEGTGQTASHTYNSGGDYTIKLRITDDDGATNTTSKTVSINKDPDVPTNPSPADGATGVSTSTDLSAYFEDPDGDTMDATFYWSNGTLIQEVTGIPNGTRASTDSLSLSGETTYDWYVNVTDGSAIIQSSTWSFTTLVEYERTGSEGVTTDSIASRTVSFLRTKGQSFGVSSSIQRTISFFHQFLQTIGILETAERDVMSRVQIERLEPTLINGNYNVTRNEFFKVKLNVTCLNADCGDVNVTLDPIDTTSTQADWNQGTFNRTSADRDDNSGDLGIGYLNGTSGDNLVGYWRLDRAVSGTGGNVIDYSGEGNNGTTNGGVTTGATGIMSTDACDFDGSDDYVEVSDDDSLDIQDELTISLWFKVEGASKENAWSRAFSKGQSTNSNGAYGVWIKDSTDPTEVGLRFFDTGDTKYDISASLSNYDDGNWHHTVVIYSNSNDKGYVYFDGSLKTNKDITGDVAIRVTTDSLHIGDGNNERHFNGKIDEARIWNRSLSQEEVEDLYFQGMDGKFNGTYTAQKIDTSGEQSWDKLEADTSLNNQNGDAIFQALDSGGSVVEEQVVDLTSGNNNYTLNVQNSQDARVKFNYSSDNETETSVISSFDVYYSSGTEEYSQMVSQVLETSENASRQGTIGRTNSEQITSDSIAESFKTRLQTAGQTMGLTDLASSTGIFPRLAIQTLGITQTSKRQTSLFRQFLQSIGIVETTEKTYKERQKNIIPTESEWTPDDAFYTDKSSNPVTLSGMTMGESRQIEFWVNATGDVTDRPWEFFAYANQTSDPSVSDETQKWNVTIANQGYSRTTVQSMVAGTETGRFLRRIRFMGQLLNLQDSISTFRTLPEAVAQQLDLNAVSERLTSISRTLGQPTALIDRISTFRILPKVIGQQLNINTFTSRISKIFRGASDDITLSENIDSFATRVKDSVQQLDLAISTQRLTSIFRTEGQEIAFTDQISKFSTRVKSLGQGISVNTAIERITNIFRTEGQPTILTDRITSFPTRVKSLGQGILVNTATQRLTSISRSLGQQLQITTQISTFRTLPQTLTETLNINTATQRLTNIFRIETQTITLDIVSSRISSAFRIQSQPLNIDSLITRASSIFRTEGQSVDLTSISSRISSISRILGQETPISTEISTFRTLPKTIEQSLQLNTVTERTTSIFRTLTESIMVKTEVMKEKIEAVVARDIGQEIPVFTRALRESSIFRTKRQPLNFYTATERLSSVYKTSIQSINVIPTVEKTYGVKRMWVNSISSKTPTAYTMSGETEITDLGNVTSSDNKYVSTSSSDYPYHKFLFDVEKVSVVWVNFSWEGHLGDSSDTAYLYVWNYTKGNWTQLDSGSGTSDFVLQKKITETEDVLSPGRDKNVTFLVQDPPGNKLAGNSVNLTVGYAKGISGLWIIILILGITTIYGLYRLRGRYHGE